jgi:hypothetical protein
MNSKKWLLLILCVGCLLVAGCTAEEELTASGSDGWSRGTVVGTAAEEVAVAVWEDTTFVAWVAESGQLRLAWLDAALGLQGVTDLALTAAYPRDLHLQAEAADRLHLAWVDSVEGVLTVVHARLVPGESEPAFQQEIPLPADARHAQVVARLEAGRLEIFWSADDNRNSGIYHQAVGLEGDEVAPAARLTETGWQPGVGWGPSGVMYLAWVEQGPSGSVAVWHAAFDPAGQSLKGPAPAAEVRLIRRHVFQGPAVGGAGTKVVLVWSTGSRIERHGFYDSQEQFFGGPLNPAGDAARAVRGDVVQYVMVSPAAAGATPVHPLTTGEVVEAWKAPRLRTLEDRAWAIFSGWVARRGSVRLQVVVVPFGAQGRGEPVAVTNTWRASMWSDLAVGTDGTLRAAWLEPIGDEVSQVVVASTAPEALDALGGFRLAEWWGEVVGFWFDMAGLLAFSPLVIGWTVLPLGLVLVGTFVSHGRLPGWKAAAWLGAAAVLQLVCKRLLFPSLMVLGPDSVEIGLSLAPFALGAGLMWVYWRRAEEPLLVAAYGLFAGMDAIFSLFVLMPRLVWGA